MKTSFVSSSFSVCAVVLPTLFFAIQSTASAAAPVVGLWRFNEGSGTNALDSSGLGNDGTLVGENGNVPGWDASMPGFGGALRFTNDGSDHAYVSIPGSSSLLIGQSATNPWTLALWAYEDSAGSGTYVSTYGRFLVLDGGDAFQFESGATGDEELYTWSRETPAWEISWGIASPVAPPLDQWVHWAVVYDGTNLTIYRNGNQGASAGIASTAVSAALGYSGYTGSILIGSELAQPADRNWNGLLDDVAVFAGALSEAEIRAIMSGDFSAHLGGPAHILAQPQSRTVQAGANISFTVQAQGISPLLYQWYFNGTNQLAGATNATLSLTNVQPIQYGTYSVEVSNSLGNERSQPAQLVVSTNQNLLVGLWRFNEGSGTNALDSSGLGNDGTLTGENGNVPGWDASMPGFGGALRFTNDGSDHAYVSIPGSSTLLIGQTATNPWTLALWAYEDSAGSGTYVSTYGRFLVLDGGDAFQFESGATGDEELYTWGRETPAWQFSWGVGSPVGPPLDQWAHWAVVYDGTNLTIYRNGNQGANAGISAMSVSAALGYNGYTGSILIGSELAQPADRNWNGLLDDVAVFNTALSEPQIQQVMSGDFTSFITRPALAFTGSPGTLTLSWSSELAGFHLQSSPTLASPHWTNVPAQPVRQGAQLSLTLPASSQDLFFRLSTP